MTKTKNSFSRMMLSFALVAALLGVVFMLAACEEGTPTSDSIAGTYNYESVTIQAVEEEAWMQTEAEASVLVLNEDQTGVFSFLSEQTGFTYSRVGNNVTITIIFRGEHKIWYGVLNGSRLTLDVRFNASLMMRIVFKKA
ncbi:MAG: hypothetical protein LBN07_04470 [Christensenellaceae bacterium]|jgi:hypothetical protein|nr:hypothetical protein [Christensenellaceae bacterium]